MGRASTMTPNIYVALRLRVPRPFGASATAAAARIPRNEFFARPAWDHRSPTRCTRAGTVSIVNDRGSSDGTTSFQRNGVETVAPGFARTE